MRYIRLLRKHRPERKVSATILPGHGTAHDGHSGTSLRSVVEPPVAARA
jgi:hypothetical protein